jgi:YidC/Oxa1 family membrane protein insertase
MKTDKSTVIGFVLLGGLFFAYFWYTSNSQQQYLAEKKRIEDSIAKANPVKILPVDTVAVKTDSLQRDSVQRISTAGDFLEAANGKEEIVTVENELVKIYFTNKGGQIKSVELKNFTAYNNKNVVLGGNKFDEFSYPINTSNNQSAQTSELFFTHSGIQKNGDGSQEVKFVLASVNGQEITHQYIISKNNYLVDFNILINGANKLLTGSSLNLNWQVELNQQQHDKKYEKEQIRFCFVKKGDYDFEHAATGIDETYNEPLQFVTAKQQFFNSTLLNKSGFQSSQVKMKNFDDSAKALSNATFNLKMQLPNTANATVPLQFYFGPNDYNILKKYNNQMENIVDLGSGIFAFVKYINRWIIMPVFNFFASFISNFGWVIMFLTIFIRLVTSPLTYSSYLSGAKMKLMRPELDILKKKFGDDQQGYAMEQMKVFREAGINPLGGCIPALLQIPIFFALYSYFNSAIELRGQSFLWAKDLSQYDVIYQLPFSIPLNYGDHISLFTITAVITSFLISIYNMSMTPDQNNPMLKYMPYIFPFVLLFVFNRLPSALTWYYTVSNVITLIIQFIIQKYIIDHDKILAQIDLKRKTPKTKSKWQQKYDEMLESQKKLKNLKK